MKKNLPLILSICALAAAIAALVLVLVPCCQKSGDKQETTECSVASGAIVFFNLDKVIESYDMAKKMQADFETKAAGIDKELARRQSKLEAEDKDLADKLNKGLIIRSVAEVKYNELQQKAADFQNYLNQKRGELAEEQQVMLNSIANSVMEYVQKYNSEHNYSLILSTQGNLLTQPVVAGDSAIDITADIISGLNAEYAASK